LILLDPAKCQSSTIWQPFFPIDPVTHEINASKRVKSAAPNLDQNQ